MDSNTYLGILELHKRYLVHKVEHILQFLDRHISQEVNQEVDNLLVEVALHWP